MNLTALNHSIVSLNALYSAVNGSFIKDQGLPVSLTIEIEKEKQIVIYYIRRIPMNRVKNYLAKIDDQKLREEIFLRSQLK